MNRMSCIWLRKILLLSLCVTILLPFKFAFAWGQYGHVTICEITYRELSADAREKLVTLIKAEGTYTSFNRACLQADRTRRTRTSAHYVNYPRTLRAVVDDNCHSENECVIEAINKDVGTLSDTSKSSAERGKALIYLGHWVGDIHQPLHVSFADDRGGNRIKKRGTCSSSNLHSVWDSCILERKIMKGNVFQRALGLSKFTRSYRAADALLADISDADRQSWNASTPVDWAKESYEITLSPDVGYCVDKGASCWYSDTDESFSEDTAQRTIQMNDEYLSKFEPVVRQRLSQAGVRLANLIEVALSANE